MQCGFLDRHRTLSNAATSDAQIQPDAASQELHARLAEVQPPPVQSGEASAPASDVGCASGSESEEEKELSGSELGRQAYWEEAYKQELANFDDHGDEGEVWFGRDVLDTVVQWTGDLVRRKYGALAAAIPILDVGCGNGTMLVGLAAQGFSNLTGQDYSMKSCRLARKVLQRHGLSHIPIKFEDLLNCNYGVTGVNVVTDKGTLDAIGLSDNPEARKQYRSSVWHLLVPEGILIVTSCNSTREELIEEFCGSDRDTEPCAYNTEQCTHTRWRVVDWVKTYPTFKFGGVEGSKVCTVALQKNLPFPPDWMAAMMLEQDVDVNCVDGQDKVQDGGFKQEGRLLSLQHHPPAFLM